MIWAYDKMPIQWCRQENKKWKKSWHFHLEIVAHLLILGFEGEEQKQGMGTKYNMVMGSSITKEYIYIYINVNII